jgi:ankyrin repeat protein
MNRLSNFADRNGLRASTKKAGLMDLVLEKRWNEVSARLLAHPKEAREWKKLSLRTKCDNEEQEQVVEVATSTERTSPSSSRPSKALPLHIALERGAPSRVIHQLIRANKKALGEKESYYKRNPLHFACLYDAETQVIEMLYNGNPKAATNRDSLGRLPLHYAAFGKAQAATFQFLLQKHPEGTQLGEMHGWIPLHVAAKVGCSFDILKLLIETAPQTLQKTTTNGANVMDIVRHFYGVDSPVERRLWALRAALEAVYDMERGHISLGMVANAVLEEEAQMGLLRVQCQNTLDESISTVSTERASESASDEGDKRRQQDQLIEDPHEQSATTSTQNTALLAKQDGPNEHDLFISEEDVVPTCVICIDAPRTHAFVPCGHLCVCLDCASLPEMRGGTCGKTCPVCRQKSFLVMRIYS